MIGLLAASRLRGEAVTMRRKPNVKLFSEIKMRKTERSNVRGRAGKVRPKVRKHSREALVKGLYPEVEMAFYLPNHTTGK